MIKNWCLCANIACSRPEEFQSKFIGVTALFTKLTNELVIRECSMRNGMRNSCLFSSATVGMRYFDAW